MANDIASKQSAGLTFLKVACGTAVVKCMVFWGAGDGAASSVPELSWRSLAITDDSAQPSGSSAPQRPPSGPSAACRPVHRVRHSLRDDTEKQLLNSSLPERL